MKENTDYSQWSVHVYKGLDAFGDCTQEEHARILELYEDKLGERFPGIQIFETLDPYTAGIYDENGRAEWMEPQTDKAFQAALEQFASAEEQELCEEDRLAREEAQWQMQDRQRNE